MYYETLKLKQAPFADTPDPAFFVSTPEHREALAGIILCVEQRRGLVLITGDPGSGKTLLARMLPERLKPEALTAVINTPAATRVELLRAVCRGFDVAFADGATVDGLTASLKRFLVAQHSLGHPTVVVVDQAHKLSVDALQQLRVLSDLETDTTKLLQIVLLGRPELEQTLHRPELRQLRQRSYCSRHLGPLNREQTAEYIRHRLRVAGSEAADLFTPDAVSLIYEASAGLPRMVNRICDNSLLTASGDSKPVVDRAVVRHVLDHVMATGPAGTEPDEANAQQEALELHHRLSALREEAAAEVTHLSAEVTRSAQAREGIQQMLADCDRAADRLFLLDDRTVLAGEKIERLEALLSAAAARVGELEGVTARAGELDERLRRASEQGTLVSEDVTQDVETVRASQDRLRAMMNDADRSVGRLQDCAQAAEQVAKKVEDSVTKWMGLARDTQDSRAAVAEAAAKLAAAIEAANARTAEARQAVALIDSRTKALTACQQAVGSLTARTEHLEAAAGALENNIRSLAGQVGQLLDNPNQVVRRADATAKRLTEVLRLARKVLQALSIYTLKANEQIRTFRQLRETSDEGVARLLTQTRASAETLHRWVEEAERAHLRLCRSVRDSLEQGGDGEDFGRLAETGRELIPALEAMLERRAGQEFAS